MTVISSPAAAKASPRCVRLGHAAQHGGRAVRGRAHLGEAFAAAGEDGELARLPSLGVDDGDLVARAKLHRGDRAGVHPVTLQPRVGRQQARQEEAGPASGHRPRVGRGLALR